MKCMIVSLESFQKGEVPPEVVHFLSSCYKKGKEPFIILDESSKIKTNNPCKAEKKSKRTQAVLKLGNVKADRCIMTGTFMSKSPVNAYDQMNFLCPSFFQESMFAFAEHYTLRRSLKSVRGARVLLPKKDYDDIRKKLLKFKANPDSLYGAMNGVKAWYGVSEEDCKFILEHEDYTPFKHLDNLWQRIGDCCMRVKASDVFDRPPKVYKTVNLELTKKQKELYLSLQNIHCTDKLTVTNGLELYLRFQDICNGYEPEEVIDGEGTDEEERNVILHPMTENPKINALMEILEDLGNEQVVVWCSRTQLLYDAKDRADKEGFTTGVFDGKGSDAQRQKDYDGFSKGEVQVLFANQGSGAYGLDRLKEAKYAVYLCNDYSVEKRVQSEDRIYRGEVKENKYIIDLTFKGTCEDRVTEAIKQGKELVSTGNCDARTFELEDEIPIF